VNPPTQVESDETPNEDYEIPHAQDVEENYTAIFPPYRDSEDTDVGNG